MKTIVPHPEGSTLATYFREQATIELLSKEDELEIAKLIVKCRNELWMALLAYVPFTEDIAQLLHRHHAIEVDSITASARAFRARETKANNTIYQNEVASLVVLAAAKDVDQVVSDLVIADIQGFVKDARHGAHLKARAPYRGSRPFALYAGAVLAAKAALRAAHEKLTKANLRLVVTLARRFRCASLELADLIQEGNLGLMKAGNRFDHRRGFRFSTYASWWIRHAISRAIADKGREVRLPVHVLDAQQKLLRLRRDFETLHGRAPSKEELCFLSGISPARQETMETNLTQSLPLDAPVPSTELVVAEVLVASDETDALLNDLQHTKLMETLTCARECLRPLEAEILAARFAEDDKSQTLKELGNKHNLSRERIRQIQEVALGKLRRYFVKHGVTL